MAAYEPLTQDAEAAITPSTAESFKLDSRHPSWEEDAEATISDLLVQADGPIPAPDGLVTWMEEVQAIARYSTPLFINQALFRYLAMMGPVIYMGMRGSNYAAGASLALSTEAILVWTPQHSAASALDTLSTQAHGGQSRITFKDLNRLYALRVLFLMMLTLLVLIPLLCYFEPIFLWVGVEAEVAHIAAMFMRSATIGTPAFFFYECLRRYLQAQNLNFGPAVAIGVAAVPMLILERTDVFGVFTPAVSLGIFYNCMFLAELVYAIIFLPRGTFTDLPSFKVVTQDMGIVVRLTLAGLVSVGSDYAAWSILNYAAAFLGNVALAANAVFITSSSILFSLPAGLSMCAATRVGNALGANRPKDARLAAFTSAAVVLVTATATAIVFAWQRVWWSSLFTSDAKVLETVYEVLPFWCLINLMDDLQGVGTGILRGGGMPLRIARIMATAHWLVGIPAVFILAFPMGMGLFGLWLGFGVGLVLVCGQMGHIIWTNDWNASALAAQTHLELSSERAHQLQSD